MLDELHLTRITHRAEEDFSEAFGLGAKQGAAQNGVVLCDAGGEAGLGVVHIVGREGEVVTLVTDGDVQVKAGDAFAIGDDLTVDGDAKFVEAGAGDVIWGVAMSAASADEDMAIMRIIRGRAAIAGGG